MHLNSAVVCLRRWALAALMGVLMGGCAGGRVVDEWADAEHSTSHGKVLVLVVRYGGPYQEIAEEDLFNALQGKGIAVAKRSDVFRASERLDTKKVQDKLASTDIDAVLLVSLGPVGSSGRGRPSLLSAPRGSLGDFEDEVSYILSMGGNRPGIYRTDNVEVDVIAKLYDVATAKPIWHLVVRSDNPGSAGLLISKTSRRIAKSLKQSGLVEP